MQAGGHKQSKLAAMQMTQTNIATGNLKMI
jgi:hypothetical protein